MEQLNKHEPQELRHDDAEESKSSAEQWTDMSAVDKQPQSLIMQESPLISEQSARLRRYSEFRALQS